MFVIHSNSIQDTTAIIFKHETVYVKKWFLEKYFWWDPWMSLPN